MSRTIVEWGLLTALTMPPAGAAEVNRSWEKLVETAKVGKKVAVRRMDSARVEGKLLRITAESILVEGRDRTELIQRGDVWRVNYVGSRGRNALIGLGVGAGLGLAIWAANPGTANPVGEAVVGAGIVGGIGTALCAAAPTTGKLLYEAVARPK